MVKILILCGGFGSRFNNGKPGPLKPLIKINKETILEKIMAKYKKISNPTFILLGGYKFNQLKTFVKSLKNKYNVIAVNTGTKTNTAGRILKVKKYLENEKNFFLTYGDSIASYNPLIALKKNKIKNESIICLHKYKIPYGVVSVRNKKIIKFSEKDYSVTINAGYYLLSRKILNYIRSFNQSFEKDILPYLIKNKIINFDYMILKKWYPIDNKYDLEKFKNLN